MHQMTISTGRSCGIILAAAIVIYICFAPGSTAHAMSFGEWWDICSVDAHRSFLDDDKLPAETKAKQAAACDGLAKTIFNQAGYGYASEEQSQRMEELRSACPRLWKSPIGGPYILVTDFYEKRGGPSFWERWLPASILIKHAYGELFPNCPAARARLGTLTMEP